MTDAFTFGKAIHEAMLEGWPFSWVETKEQSPILIGYPSDAVEVRPMRGWSAATDFPRDPDGLHDIDPIVEELLSLSKRENVMVVIPSYGMLADSWVRELFEREHVTLTETSPCAWDDPDASPMDLLRGLKAKMMEPTPPYDALTHDGRILEMKTIVDESFHLKDVFVRGEPPRPGVRYGPYDADPHTKGRRRRFRNQRRT